MNLFHNKRFPRLSDAEKTFKVATKDGKGKKVVKEMNLEEKDEYMALQGEKAALAKRKRVRQMQNKSRALNR